MSFDRIRDDLNTLEECLSGGREITAEDIFNAIRDLCEDVRCDTGSSVEQKAAGSPAQLLRQLPWLGRMVTKQYRRIQSHVADMGRKEELSQKMEELDRLSEEMELLSGQTEVLAQKELQLRQQYEKVEAQSREKAQIQAACTALEEKLRQLSQGDMVTLQQRRSELQADLQAAETACRQSRELLEQLEQRAAAQKSENTKTRAQVQSREAEISALTAESRELQERLEETNAAIGRLEDQRDAVKTAWIMCSQAQLPEAQKALEDQRLLRDQAMADLESARQEKQALDTETQELEQTCKELRGDILETTARREKLHRDASEKLTELERLRGILKELDNECAQLQQQLDQLMGDLAGKDAQQVKENLSEAISQKQQVLKEYHELQIRVQDEEKFVRDQAQKNEAAVAQEQELKRQAELENQKAQERILALGQQIAALRQQREQLMTQESQLKSQVEQLQGWLKSLSLEQYTQRLEGLRQRNDQLMKAKAALEEDLTRLMQIKGISSSELDMSLFEASFRDTERWILHYQKLFGQTVRLLSSGEGT